MNLPARLFVASVLCFFVFTLFSIWIVANPSIQGAILWTLAILMLLRVFNAMASMGRVLMHSGSLSTEMVLEEEKEEKLSPHELTDILLDLVPLSRKAQIPVNYQYRIPYQKTLQDVKLGKLETPISQEYYDNLKQEGEFKYITPPDKNAYRRSTSLSKKEF